MLNELERDTLREIEQELSQIRESDFSFRSKFLELKRLLEQSCKAITMIESLQFSSLFSRIVFIAQKYHVPASLEQNLHQIRVVGNFLLRREDHVVTEKQFNNGIQTLDVFIHFLINGEYKQVETIAEGEEKQSSLNKIRVQVIDIHHEENILICRPRDISESVISVKYNVSKVNAVFNDTIDHLWQGAQLNLIDCRIDEQGYYIPSMFVLEPDYLIDASAMAECFQSYGNSHLHYFRRKFEPMANTHYILLGNLANFFLDELIYAEKPDELDFSSVFLKSFKEMPFEFTSCEEIQSTLAFQDFMIKAHRQFENIKRVVLSDMMENGFSLDKCTLEPSFYSEKYGFQGRLDLLQLKSEDNFTRIIELKSGKTPWPQDDVTKIASNHEVQTTIYRMMIGSVFSKSVRDIHAMILYSSADGVGHNLRLSAPYKQLEKEIVNVRNLIIATEHRLYSGGVQEVKEVFAELFELDNYGGRIPDFFVDKLTEVKKVLEGRSDVELTYFFRYISFISRELYLQKVGDESFESAMSIAALWNTSFQERKEALELLSDLKIETIEEEDRGMMISFRRQKSIDFGNFREGEICIVYPRQSEEDTILSNQILKGTVISISVDHLLIRFRYKQRNKTYFENNKYWTVEHDKLDHAYNSMFKSLFAFLQSSKEKRDLLLGLSEPRSNCKESCLENISQKSFEKMVVEKAVEAKDYFLIVGPPGTGKTSIYARKLIEKYYSQEDTNILIIAYTNRAVDELCAAICSAFEQNGTLCDRYIRIGSEYSCAEAYRSRLLQNVSAKARRRDELLEELHSTRIFVGTLASIVGKPELLGIKKFDVAIIDEASQILEPQIIGLLPHFDKFIMIGDHKQLSTITMQDEQKSRISDPVVNQLGFYDCRESIFERLFRVAKEKGWGNVYETLSYHGRMHQDIAELVNDSFYEGILIPATERQLKELVLKSNSMANARVSFIHVDNLLLNNLTDKTNLREAQVVVEVAKELLMLYQENGRIFDSDKTLGIIAPYRNQIALIKHLLQSTGISELQNIMVDTVERYQGSQRDVVVLSFGFNNTYQMRSFGNVNRDKTVDRKLNVALTRAREQLFLVGNENILKKNELYRSIIFERSNISKLTYRDMFMHK